MYFYSLNWKKANLNMKNILLASAEKMGKNKEIAKFNVVARSFLA